jgi:hypothetical protein
MKALCALLVSVLWSTSAMAVEDTMAQRVQACTGCSG